MKHIRKMKIGIEYDEKKIGKKTIIEWLDDFAGIEGVIEL